MKGAPPNAHSANLNPEFMDLGAYLPGTDNLTAVEKQRRKTEERKLQSQARMAAHRERIDLEFVNRWEAIKKKEKEHTYFEEFRNTY